MSIYNLCISHKTAPATIRELFAFRMDEKVDFIKSAIQLEHISECVLITTCNRSEIYMNGEEEGLEELISYLRSKKDLDNEKILNYFLVYKDKKAIEHLFKVTSGIDSMLIGEDEILGQVKDAYQLALDSKTTGFLLNTLFRDAITCAKKVKTDTMVSKTSVSLGTLAAHAVFDFQTIKTKKRILIIGLTGKMGTILMKNLYSNSNLEIMGTIRSHNKPLDLEISYPKVRMVPYLERYNFMDEADIIVSATTSPHYTITKEELEENLSVKKERLFIDLSIPLDIDKKITKIDGVSLIDIDQFTKLSKENNILKLKEVERAKLIIKEEVDEFLKWIYFREFVPLLPDLNEMVYEKGIEKIIYEMRNNTTSEELIIVLNNFKGLLRKK